MSTRLWRPGITPVMDIGVAGRGGGQIGAGVFRAPLAVLHGRRARTPQTPTSERSRDMGMFHSHGKGNGHSHFDREQLRGTQIMRRIADIPTRKAREQLERGIDLGPGGGAVGPGPHDLDVRARRSSRRSRASTPSSRPTTARTSGTSASTTSRSSARRSTWAPRTGPGAGSARRRSGASPRCTTATTPTWASTSSRSSTCATPATSS